MRSFFFFSLLFPHISSYVCAQSSGSGWRHYSSSLNHLPLIYSFTWLEDLTLLYFTFFFSFFCSFHPHLSMSHSEPLPSRTLLSLFYSSSVSSCLPALSLSWSAPISLSVLSLPVPFLLLSKLSNARWTTSPISMPDVFIFLPAFHALLNSTERPTPLLSTGSSSSQFCLFLSLSSLWLRRQARMKRKHTRLCVRAPIRLMKRRPSVWCRNNEASSGLVLFLLSKSSIMKNYCCWILQALCLIQV